MVSLDGTSEDSPIPSALNFGIDQTTNELVWSTPAGTDSSSDIGTYTVAVTGVLPDLTTQIAFLLTIIVDCSVCTSAYIYIDPTYAKFLLSPTISAT